MAKKNEIVVRNSKTQTLLVGALVGAFAGLTGAFLLNRRASRQGREAALTPVEGLQLGILVFGLLRAIAALGEK
jgi:ABC-type Mn2+/Zn2+ transport system permease subunit